MLAQLAKVIRNRPQVFAQVSFEQFMGCGIGVCRACVIKTHKGYRRICKEGPVFNIRDVF
jgi:dihydroorotate dehydrogenase electron transfer subunit